jgi:hypothetical protein
VELSPLTITPRLTHHLADEFAVTPGIHTQDLSYTFSERNATMPYPKAQNGLQQAIASFTLTGTPTLNDNGETRLFPQYGTDESLVVFTGADQTVGRDNVNGTRCAWWAEYQQSK